MEPQSRSNGNGTDRVKEALHRAKKDVKETLHHKGQDVASYAESSANSAKPQVADRIYGVASAVEQAGTRLRQEGEPLGETAEVAGRKLFELSDLLRRESAADLMARAQKAARSNPPLFIGGAAILGFVAARYLKASTPAPDEAHGALDEGGKLRLPGQAPRPEEA